MNEYVSNPSSGHKFLSAFRVQKNLPHLVHAFLTNPCSWNNLTTIKKQIETKVARISTWSKECLIKKLGKGTITIQFRPLRWLPLTSLVISMVKCQWVVIMSK